MTRAPTGPRTAAAPSTAAEVETLLGQMYGEVPGPGPSVIHVAAVWQPDATRYVSLAIGSAAPVSALDGFALAAARARADAIVTTGANLRAEPALRHQLAGPAAAALSEWRREHLGKRTRPVSLVLSRGARLPLAHPLLRAADAVVFTGHAGARALADAGLCAVAADAPGLTAALAYLREQRGCATILVEAGASTTRALYAPGEDAGPLDELLLSVFAGAELPPEAQAGAFASPAAVRARLPRRSAGRQEHTPRGTWRFERCTRGAEGAPTKPRR
ncbi:hypothetical protein [Haliangium ochraceum]|uniref:Bacterial bifunctional deaminase-reductase C-terminal domain-containing protein n=1 Tax=Haliangium ochraceum (strain DSM 14365 / JCM 11303 / SMP-2) TaxID=502025 RepID=D0LLA9_HALO1|nr:hypothetical protein [Haliangium ochraceum]ACY18605.1 hypothetical protein Hoch_6130 [Haliangium ochraceum DSM 14365]